MEGVEGLKVGYAAPDLEMDEAEARRSLADVARLARATYFVGALRRGSLELSKRSAEVLKKPFQPV